MGFRLDPQPCELAINIPLAIHSLTNYGHIVLFAWFFVMTRAQFRTTNWSAFAWAAMAATVMGVLIEIDEGVTGKGHCRLRDLIPNAVGVLLGTVIVLLWERIRRTPRPS
jgi:VanZ family protein